MPRVAFFSLWFLTGCAAVTAPRVGVTTLASSRYPERPSDYPVKLFQTQLPHCAFEELAIVTVRPKTFWTKSDDLVDLVRSNARQLGGDAVVNFKSERTVEGASPSTDGAVEIDHGLLMSGTVVGFRGSRGTE
jgi:hypothetical protein